VRLSKALNGKIKLKELVISRLSSGSIFKLLLIGMGSCQVVFTLLVMGLMFLSGAPLEAPDGESITYFSSYSVLALYLFFGLVTVPFWAGLAWVIIFPCMWLYSKIRPIKIRYLPSA